MSRIKIGGITYFIGFILTNGWFAADPCPDTASSRKEESETCGSRGIAIFEAFYVASVWPIYWNYKLFEIVRKR